MNPLRILVISLTLVASLALAACGAEEESHGTDQAHAIAETEGFYVDVDKLKYQVQISRQLNPLLTDDRDYLEDLAGTERELGADEEWFAIFMRVENDTEEPIQNAQDFEIHDTQGNVYRPLEFGPANNFAYRAATVEPNELYPIPNSTPGERAPNGAVLLFKLRRFSLDNRPLELIIKSRASDQQATINLDV